MAQKATCYKSSSLSSLCAQLSTERAQYLNSVGQDRTSGVLRVITSVYLENHRMAEAGRSYWKSSCPNPSAQAASSAAHGFAVQR